MRPGDASAGMVRAIVSRATATRSIRAVAKSGGTTADSGADLALTLNSYADFQGIGRLSGQDLRPAN